MIAVTVAVLAAVLVGALIGVGSVLAAFAFAAAQNVEEPVQYVLDEAAVDEEFEGIAATWEDDDE